MSEQTTESAEFDALLAPLDALAAYWSASDHRTWVSTCGDELTDALIDLRRGLNLPPATTDGRCCPGAGSMVHVRGCVNHPEAGR